GSYRRALLIAAAILSPSLSQANPVGQGPPSSVCVMAEENAAWIRTALDNWESVRRDDLHVNDAPLPWLILFDSSCAWHLKPQSAPMYGVPHLGRITLPDDEMI